MDAEAGTTGWRDLANELDLWAGEGRVARLWWRDDDAGEPVPALLRLLDLSEASGLALALAVVPAAADAQLATALDGRKGVTVVQHGWAHRNHGKPGEPAVEVGGLRAVAEVLREMKDGHDRLQALFGPSFDPILVPPWNRIDPPVTPHLVAAGYRGLSTFGTRDQAEPEAGLIAVNTHVDILRWRGGAHFAGPAKVLRQLIGHLQDRRQRADDRDEPIGLLTHHKDHDASAWAFLETLFGMTGEHPAAAWLSVAKAFARDPLGPTAPEISA